MSTLKFLNLKVLYLKHLMCEIIVLILKIKVSGDKEKVRVDRVVQDEGGGKGKG